MLWYSRLLIRPSSMHCSMVSRKPRCWPSWPSMSSWMAPRRPPSAVGEPWPRVRIDVILLDLPRRVLVLFRQDVVHLPVCSPAVKAARAAVDPAEQAEGKEEADRLAHTRRCCPRDQTMGVMHGNPAE